MALLLLCGVWALISSVCCTNSSIVMMKKTLQDLKDDDIVIILLEIMLHLQYHTTFTASTSVCNI